MTPLRKHPATASSRPERLEREKSTVVAEGEVSVVVQPVADEVPDEAVVTTMSAAKKVARVTPLVRLAGIMRKAPTFTAGVRMRVSTAVEEEAEEEVEAAEGDAARDEEVKEVEDGRTSRAEAGGVVVMEEEGKTRRPRRHPPRPPRL